VQGSHVANARPEGDAKGARLQTEQARRVVVKVFLNSAGIRSPLLPWEQRGAVLPGVLVFFLMSSGLALLFVSFMDHQQRGAGARYNAALALGAAEAGIYRMLAALESDLAGIGGGLFGQVLSGKVEGGGRSGEYVVSVSRDRDGGFVLESRGQAGETVRRLRVRVRVAPPALLAALATPGTVKIDGYPAALVIAPYHPRSGELPWVHVMVGRGVWFASTQVTLNTRVPGVELAPGPVGTQGTAPTELSAPGVRILLVGTAELTVGTEHSVANVTGLRTFGVPLENVVVRPGNFPRLYVDRHYFKQLAAMNSANAALNRAAAGYVNDAPLYEKHDSVYSGAQFLHLISYAASRGVPLRLHGVIYVEGTVVLPVDARIVLEEGALVTESTLHLGPGAQLSVMHEQRTRTLPALLVLEQGQLTLAPGARLAAHGLVYVNQGIALAANAVLDVVGSVYVNHSGLAFVPTGAFAAIRYDPAILGTPGLLTVPGEPRVAWVVAWEEIR
jgi:hypothetical protein